MKMLKGLLLCAVAVFSFLILAIGQEKTPPKKDPPIIVIGNKQNPTPQPTPAPTPTPNKPN